MSSDSSGRRTGFVVIAIAALAWAAASPALAGRDEAIQVTPVIARVLDAPVPVRGSDGAFHVVYEVELVNFTGVSVAFDALDVLDASTGNAVATIDKAALARRLVVRDRHAARGSLGPAQSGIAYLHLTFDDPARIPKALVHRLTALIDGKPTVETVARIDVAPATDLVFDPPLRGTRFIAGDGCCDSTRHVRATLPLDGRLHTAQRFAIDWEQLDTQGRIYVGDPKEPRSYVIYGQPVQAVADARVVAAVDGLPDSPPGGLPAGLPIAQADGNHVVLDLGGGHFALYAHLAPNSVAVKAGERVHRGDVLGHVGTSGNSSEPHLHFQVTDGPSPLVSNGLPYLLTRFRVHERGVSTAAFDRAIIDGKPIPTERAAGEADARRAMPLDLSIVDFE